VRQESVQKRIETTIDVGETGARYLHDNEPRRDREAVLNEESDVQRQPADGEDGNDDDHHQRDTPL